MYDIIFDFSASPVGGGLLRLKEYIHFFNEHNNNVLFLVHPRAPRELFEGLKCKIVVLPRSPLKRIFFDSTFLKEYIGKARRFFSYGIPIYKRVGELNWMHLSNALPFGYRKCSLNTKNKIKNYILFSKFQQIDKSIEFISGESQSTIDLFSALIESSAKKIILHNGFNKDLLKSIETSDRSNIALTVGGESYKRLDLVYNCFLELKEKKQTRELIIKADIHQVPFEIREKEDVKILGYLPYHELLELYKRSAYYISMSEIENSSNAVLEALYCGCTAILSRIPSHLEMFSDSLASQSHPDYFVATKDNLKKENSFSWGEIIKRMCKIMNVEIY